MLMGHGKQRANGHCLRYRIGLLPNGVCVPSARLATLDASEGKSFGRARRSCRCIPESRVASFGNPGNAHAMRNEVDRRAR
jgi:hypothetical protein